MPEPNPNESTITELRDAFRSLTEEYIRALQTRELGVLAAQPTLNSAAAGPWLDAMNFADEINGRRLAAREDLLAALRANE